MESEEFNKFVRVQAGIKHFTLRLIPLVSGIFETWHQALKKKIGSCPIKTERQPTAESCPQCDAWKYEIQACFYSPSTDKGHTMKWNNVNLCKLHANPLEIAKLFAVGELPQELYEYGDFDATHLLTILMTCNKFHQEDSKCYDLIKQVSILWKYSYFVSEKGIQ